ncbi:hypothetical protein CC2G_000132 [Coprinopsis cinerea AmutBmut pab1-1]|nr:hypothetical protein CC2G_000132 [Coprinopsis cinerea AmutBmut pab1-1]
MSDTATRRARPRQRAHRQEKVWALPGYSCPVELEHRKPFDPRHFGMFSNLIYRNPITIKHGIDHALPGIFSSFGVYFGTPAIA